MGVSRDVFDKRIRQAVKASAIEVQDEAQTHHNYTSRTGDLTRSIDMRMLTDKSAVVYLDEGRLWAVRSRRYTAAHDTA